MSSNSRTVFHSIISLIFGIVKVDAIFLDLNLLLLVQKSDGFLESFLAHFEHGFDILGMRAVVKRQKSVVQLKFFQDNLGVWLDVFIAGTLQDDIDFFVGTDGLDITDGALTGTNRIIEYLADIDESLVTLIDDDVDSSIGDVRYNEIYLVTFLDFNIVVAQKLVELARRYKSVGFLVEIHIYEVSFAFFHRARLLGIRYEKVLLQSPIQKSSKLIYVVDFQQSKLIQINFRFKRSRYRPLLVIEVNKNRNLVALPDSTRNVFVGQKHFVSFAVAQKQPDFGVTQNRKGVIHSNVDHSTKVRDKRGLPKLFFRIGQEREIFLEYSVVSTCRGENLEDDTTFLLKEFSQFLFQLIVIRSSHITKFVHRRQMTCVQVVLGFKKSVENRRFLVSRQNSENSTTAVIDHNNLEIVRDVVVPKRVAVVEETDVTRNENRRVATSDCRTDRR